MRIRFRPSLVPSLSYPHSLRLGHRSLHRLNKGVKVDILNKLRRIHGLRSLLCFCCPLRFCHAFNHIFSEYV